MPKQYTTLKDIALHLGLHHTTISKALRNHSDIKKSTRELVQKTAREMDYHVNALARSFKNNQSSIVGICVPLINLDFFANVVCGAESVFDKAGFAVMVCQAHEDYERELRATSALISNHVAGLLISPSQSTKDVGHLDAFGRRNIPVVCFDREIKGSGFDAVVVDDQKGAFDVVSHLIETGRTRIAHFSGPENVSVTRERMKGYLDAHKHHNLEVPKDLIVHGDIHHDAGVAGMKHLLDRDLVPDGVFGVTDMVAIGAFREAEGRGLVIPEDIAIAGFGDLEMSALLNPPLTTVRQYPHRLGEVAAQMIISKIQKSDGVSPPLRKVLPAELIVRESTGR